jgi:hypothetical protein
MTLFPDLLLAIGVGLVVGTTMRFAIVARRERSAWGTERAALSFQDRREIRHALRAGRAVANPRLARPAVELGGELTAEFARIPGWLRRPPAWLTAFCLIFFVVIGAVPAVEGVLNGSVGDIALGALCFALAGLYLPVMRRWTLNRQERWHARVQDSIMANRRLGTEG